LSLPLPLLVPLPLALPLPLSLPLPLLVPLPLPLPVPLPLPLHSASHVQHKGKQALYADLTLSLTKNELLKMFVYQK
jgi:hypothetical protein